ncbi:flavin reductase family protein [Ketobacter sp.]|uniref:flavin reductase family protein n=1 Tax=Ketobacter sp. TaxID=2083498 RepID=UPI000F278BA9|nr:iron-sulfur cluster-binding domain-containing protein [Ketobacter sp.]RLT94494.1 MAG: iron-sulfur cluster-binding domain-containing protein [Ketobacter sp.]
MHSTTSKFLKQARTWINSSLFNTNRAGEYFEYLLEGVDPMWSALECKAKVVGVKQETADTKTWTLQPTDDWQGFRAGQHIHITLSINGVLSTRTFTISSSPYQWRTDGTLSITVKKVPNGKVTGWMHEHLGTNDVISISQAAGDFVLEQEMDGSVGYIAAGSGITPIMSQLRWLSANQMPVAAKLLYFANTRQDFIFGSEILALTQTNQRLSSHLIASYDDSDSQHKLPQAPICAEHIAALLESQPRNIYLCGPHPFREIAKSLLQEAGFDLCRVHEEAFGLPPLKVEAGAPVTVRFTDSATETTTDQPATLLDMAENAGLSPTAGCRMGICYTCKCKKKSGQVRNVVTGELSGNAEEDIRICISTPVSNVDIEL